jgi:hypothetical protein
MGDCRTKNTFKEVNYGVVFMGDWQRALARRTALIERQSLLLVYVISQDFRMH